VALTDRTGTFDPSLWLFVKNYGVIARTEREVERITHVIGYGQYWSQIRSSAWS
jgi:hypothetical protein